jgi:hypothetical protein
MTTISIIYYLSHTNGVVNNLTFQSYSEIDLSGCGPEVRNWTEDRWVVGLNPGLSLGCLSSHIVHVPNAGWASLAEPMCTKVA